MSSTFCAPPTELTCSRMAGSSWKGQSGTVSMEGDSKSRICDCEQEMNDDLRAAHVPNKRPCHAGFSCRVRKHRHQDYQQIRKVNRLLADGVRHPQFDRLHLGVQ